MDFFKTYITTRANPLVAAIMAIAGLSAVWACESPFDREPAARTFVVRKGEHYATPRLTERMTSERLKFKATFDNSAIYLLEDPAMQSNKNKLMGFSDCGSPHHENSARFAWQWFNDRLEIYAYCYVDSVRTEQFAGTVAINEENLYEIVASEAKYDFFLNGDLTATIPRSTSCNSGNSYMLYPYFGGSVAAPHDVTIKVEIVN